MIGISRLRILNLQMVFFELNIISDTHDRHTTDQNDTLDKMRFSRIALRVQEINFQETNSL